MNIRSALFILMALFAVAPATWAQSADTLCLIVRAPRQLIVDSGRKADVDRLAMQLKDGGDRARTVLNARLQTDTMSWYTLTMLQNRFRWFDSLNVRRAVAYIAQDYLSYRLYRPYKIKQRLVLLQDPVSQTASDTFTANADFSVSITQLRFTSIGSRPCAVATVELYDVRSQRLLWSQTHTGYAEREETDMPLCGQAGPDCEFANAIYPSLVQALQEIGTRFTGKPLEH